MEQITSLSPSENKIDRLVARVGVSPEGDEWLKTALDPFPDVPRKCAGYPDVVNGPSVVQKLKMQRTISIPAPLFAGGLPWDTHIFFDACDTSGQDCTGYREGGADVVLGVAGQVATGLPFGGVVIRSATAGAILDQNNNQLGNMAIPPSYFTNGKTRVIAKAFEIHNVTPELTKSGTCTVYRSPDKAVQRTGMLMKNAAVPGNVGNPVGITHSYDVPTTVAATMNLQDTKVWEASKGCYVVATLASPDLPPLGPYESSGLISVDTAGVTHTPPFVANGSGNSWGFAQNNYPGNFNLSGAFFTGLHRDAILTLIVHYVIERFVNENALDLVVLTTKSPSFDPAALELYSKAASWLPTGVPVGMNADGDWIKNVADMLATFGVPGMPLVKGAVDLWNGVKTAPNKQQKSAEARRIENLEKALVSLARKDQGNVQGKPRNSQIKGPVSVKIPKPQPQKQQKRPNKKKKAMSPEQLAELQSYFDQVFNNNS